MFSSPCQAEDAEVALQNANTPIQNPDFIGALRVEMQDRHIFSVYKLNLMHEGHLKPTLPAHRGMFMSYEVTQEVSDMAAAGATPATIINYLTRCGTNGMITASKVTNIRAAIASDISLLRCKILPGIRSQTSGEHSQGQTQAIPGSSFLCCPTRARLCHLFITCTRRGHFFVWVASNQSLTLSLSLLQVLLQLSCLVCFFLPKLLFGIPALHSLSSIRSKYLTTRVIFSVSILHWIGNLAIVDNYFVFRSCRLRYEHPSL